jgi:hypothetical protein
MARRLLAGLALLAAAGCAAPPAPRAAPRPHDLDASLGSWESARGDDGGGARSTTMARAPAAIGAVTLQASPAVEVRPRRHGRVDVSFQGAEMGSAFQFLADAGRFNLVMADGLVGHVSGTLHGVDPYDALVLLAQANGVAVRFDREVVVVSKR